MSFRKLIVVLISVIFLDQVSKWLASSGDLVTLNPGVSFGWGGVAVPSDLITIFTTVAVVGGIWAWQKWLNNHWLSGGLFWGGAISNLVDRWWLGGVRDWLPIPVVNLQNNLADWFIFAGVVVLFRELFILRSNTKTL